MKWFTFFSKNIPFIYSADVLFIIVRYTDGDVKISCFYLGENLAITLTFVYVS